MTWPCLFCRVGPLVAVWLLFLNALQAQEPVQLAAGHATLIEDGTASMIMLPVVCGADGNLYLRYFRPAGAFAAPWLKISISGKRLGVFNVRAVDGFEGADSVGFAVDKSGRVFVLAKDTKGEWYIVRFAGDGQLEGSFRIGLPPRTQLTELSAFSRERFLVSGLRHPAQGEQDADQTPEPFVAVFDAAGRTATPLKLGTARSPGAAGAAATAAPGGEAKPGATAATGGASIALGKAAAGEDGNIYLLRGSESPRILVISPAGEIVREFSIASPEEGAVAVGMRLWRGRCRAVPAQEFCGRA